MRYFRKNKVGARAPRAPPLDPPLECSHALYQFVGFFLRASRDPQNKPPVLQASEDSLLLRERKLITKVCN